MKKAHVMYSRFVIISAILLGAVFSIVPSPVQAAPLCPLESDTRRTIVRFNGAIVSGTGGMKDTDAFATFVPAGTYNIILVSFDEHSGEATQLAEQWFITMKDVNGSIIGWSREIEDLPDGQQFLTQIVNVDYPVSRAMTSVVASHIRVYDSGQHSIIPVCAGFDLKDGSPLVTTDAASSIGNEAAKIEGSVNPNGTSDTFAWLEWGTTSFPLGSKTQERRITGSNRVSETITGLKKNTRYYFRAAGRNAANTSYGETLSFITTGGNVQSSPSPSPIPSPCLSCTPPCSSCPGGSSQTLAPTVFTRLPTFVAQNTAILNGHVNGDVHIPTNTWFEWGTQASLGSATTKKIAGYAYSADFSDSLIGLLPDTFYYFRAVGENSNGRSYGAVFLFRTLPISAFISAPAQPSQPLLPTPSIPIIYNPVSHKPITSYSEGLGLIALAITPFDEIIPVGTKVPFIITFENISKNLLTHGVLTVTLPPELSYQDMSGSPEDIEKNTSISGNLGVATIQIGDLAAGEKRSVTINTQLKSDTIDRKIFTTSAVITYTDTAKHIGGKETAFAINTARAGSDFGALFFAGGLWLWLLLGLFGLLLLLLIFFLLKRRKEEEDKKKV